MIILKYAADVAHHLRESYTGKSTIGFVPTMGALHDGHISLLKKSKDLCEITVCSIFINPVQFNNPEDFKKYPVTIERDIYTLEKNGCDIVFIPGTNEMYPDSTFTKKHFDLGHLENILEGKYRPGHFQGVCQAVNRLLQIVEPTHLFIGQKDYQQCMVIKRLLELENLNIKIVICPTLREKNGLAMSSRNLRLNEQQHNQASEIYKSLSRIKQQAKQESLQHLKEQELQNLSAKNFKADYIEIANADNLEIINEWDGKTPLVALAAVFVNDVRLIDNILIND